MKQETEKKINSDGENWKETRKGKNRIESGKKKFEKDDGRGELTYISL